MIHLRVFSSMEEYEATKASMKENVPFVVYEKGTDTVIYSNLLEITEDDLTSGDFVDLGLPSGLKWATCNLGATSPCEYGLLYEFGRVDGYAYRDTNNQFSITEPPTTTSGKVYITSDDVLEPADDAAYVASDGAMRMPTISEITELLNNTTNQWVSCTVLGEGHESHSVWGRLFTSKTDENKKLFFPAAGCFYGDENYFYGYGKNGYYWSSSVNMSSRNLFLSSNRCDFGYYSRRTGMSVRGVKE